MNKLDQVLNGLTRCSKIQKEPFIDLCANCPYQDDDFGTCITLNPLLEDALKIIKSLTTPIRPIWKYNNGDPCFICGSCRAEIYRNDKFCHECGRAVDWDD